MMSDPVILIPARMASTRLPGKPLADIPGEPDDRACLAPRRGGRAWPGRGRHRYARRSPRPSSGGGNGGHDARATTRRAPTASSRRSSALDPEGRHDVVVNVQGDLPTIDPRAIRRARPLADPAVDIATLAAEIIREEERTDPNVVKIVGSPIADTAPGALFHPRHRALGRGAALSPYRPLRLSPHGARALRRPAAVAAGAARAAGAVAGAGGRHAHRRRVVDDVPLGVDTPHDLERARKLLAARPKAH